MTYIVHIPPFSTISRARRRSSLLSSAWALIAGVGALVFAGSGCTTDGYPTDNTYHVQGKAPSAAPPPSSFVYRYPDMAPVLDARGLRELVDQYRNRVVLLDFWATWSATNREEMAMLARLQEDLRDDGLQVIACSIDDPEKWSQSIVPILHGARARFPCVIIPPSNRAEVRNWLEPGWMYNIPARFMIDRQGEVVMTAMSDMPLPSIEQQVRDQVLYGRPGPRLQGVIAQAAHARGKLINVNTGESESIAEVSSDFNYPRLLAEQMADQIARKIDPQQNPRIAILPFPPRAGQNRPEEYGRDTAELVEAALRLRGFRNFVRSDQIEKSIRRAGLTATTIEYDPSAIRDAIDCDYLVIGWVRTVPVSETQPQEDQGAEPVDLPIGRKSRVQLEDEEPAEYDDVQARNEFGDEFEPYDGE